MSCLEKIIDSVDPDIIALCETKKGGRLKEDELSNYEVIERNEKPGKEGVLVGVRKGSFNSIREITDTEMKCLMTVRIEYAKINVRVIVAHAPQETADDEEKLMFFEELMVQIERAVDSGEHILLAGDFNARIKQDEDGGIVPDYLSPGTVSPNGKRLSEVINKYGLQVCNFQENCSGNWTRIQDYKENEDGVEKSRIDYVLVLDHMYKSMTSMVVDEDKVFCPYRVKSVNGVKKVTYSDHCAMIMCYEIEIGRPIRSNTKKCRWQFKDEEGF